MRFLWLLMLFVPLGLAGCGNMVLSEKPLFERDRTTEASIAPGVWASPEPGCRFEAKRPVQEWPDCANGEIRSPGDFGPKATLVGGEPMILQLRIEQSSGGGYWYVAIRATAQTPQGQATAVESWPVLCGPPPAQMAGSDRRVTDTPGPGLTIDGDNCIAADALAVRSAAVASRSWWSDIGVAQWVRKRRHFDRLDRPEFDLVPKLPERAPGHE
jgi:hypothetical protein